MSLKKDEDHYTKYRITSLEKNYKPELHVERDLGIPLDLLDLSVYNPPREIPPLAPEDEELLHDDEEVTAVKEDGIRRKERPTDEGVSWLVKTQYISPLSNEAAKQYFTEKQAKESRERKGGRNIVENFNERGEDRYVLAAFDSSPTADIEPFDKMDKSLCDAYESRGC